MHPTPTSLRRRALPAALLLLTALAPSPARAIIVQEGQIAAHAAGRQLTSVVGIVHKGLIRGRDGECSGVFIGLSRDGRHGYVLTAAHPFFRALGDPEPQELHDVTLYFGPEVYDIGGPETLRVKAERLLIHPDRRCAPETASKQVQNDLALLEFSMVALDGVLEKRAIAPARLHSGGAAKRPLLAAELAGFGWFATTGSAEYEKQLRLVHAGRTRVSYGSWHGRTGFLSWTPMSQRGYQEKPAFGTLPYRFEVHPDLTMHYLAQETGQEIAVRPHRDQALFGPGDSGGPLFVRGEDGALEVAGIASSCTASLLLDRDDPAPDQAFPHYLQIWEPVHDSLPWLRAVLEAGADYTGPAEAKGAIESKEPAAATVFPAYGRRPSPEEDPRQPAAGKARRNGGRS